MLHIAAMCKLPTASAEFEIIMTPQDFLRVLLTTAPEIYRTIRTGAQWEVVAHSIISNALLEKTGRMPIREQRYANFTGVPNNDSCDLVLQDGSQSIWVEAKVEGAHTRGQFASLSGQRVTDLNAAINADAAKLSLLRPNLFTFSTPDGKQSEPIQLTKWILVIAWSPGAAATVHSVSGPNIICDISTGIAFWIGVV
ncbi:hypothetical protein [Falsiroseomonas sp. E2-1-a4]|uniref:hypothetical protein n=1 Tax=Falsiroseomonas sp. E2-1-a4 TaxID=3239299 RepID=UPI003F2E3F98